MHARRHMHVCTCNAVFKHASTGPCVQPEQLEERLHHTRAGAGVVLPADMALLHVESGQVMCQCTHVTVDSCDRLTVTTHLIIINACGARAYSAIRGGNLQDIHCTHTLRQPERAVFDVESRDALHSSRSVEMISGTSMAPAAPHVKPRCWVSQQ